MEYTKRRNLQNILKQNTEYTEYFKTLRGLLLISFAKKNQEKPLGPGYTYLSFSDLLKC